MSANITITLSKPMEVGKLKKLLKDSQIPDDALIYSEGCDCVDKAFGIRYNSKQNILVICRED